MCALALVAASCSGSPSPGPRAADWGTAQVARLRSQPFGEPNIAALTGVLTRAGVGPANAGADGHQPVRATPWQLRNLALQAANGGGVRGEDLDRLTGTPVNSPPIYDLIGGWIRVYGSPGSRFSAALLGQQDWRHANQIVFPAVILILFLADAVAAPSTPATAPTVGPTPSAGNGTASGGSSGAASRGFGDGLASGHRAVLLAVHLAAGPCTAMASFIQNAVAAVATALKVTAPGGGLFGFLGRIWNAAMDLAHGLADRLIGALTRPVTDLLVNVFGVVATIVQVSSLLTQWRAQLSAQPTTNRFGVGAETITGQFAAPARRRCARSASTPTRTSGIAARPARRPGCSARVPASAAPWTSGYAPSSVTRPAGSAPASPRFTGL